MAAPLLIVLILMCGMARAVAIAAARKLDGSKEGITAAQAAAKTTAERFKAQYRLAIVWDNEAIKFGTTPSRSGTWLSGSAVKDPSALRYVKVGTSTDLDSSHSMPVSPKNSLASSSCASHAGLAHYPTHIGPPVSQRSTSCVCSSFPAAYP